MCAAVAWYKTPKIVASGHASVVIQDLQLSVVCCLFICAVWFAFLPFAELGNVAYIVQIATIATLNFLQVLIPVRITMIWDELHAPALERGNVNAQKGSSVGSHCIHIIIGSALNRHQWIGCSLTSVHVLCSLW